MNYVLHILFMIELYVILALAMNLQLGFTGLLNLAIGAFYGLGAYLYAIAAAKLGIAFLPAVAIAVVGNMILSLIIVFASKRFKGDVFILVTLGFQVIIYTILWNWNAVTNGPYGITGIPRPEMFGFTVQSLGGFCILGGILAVLITGVSYLTYHSPFGRTLEAIRDDSVAAASWGKSIFWFKAKSITLSTGMIGFAGMLYASYITYIDPTSFTIKESIDIIFIIILGGLANVRGAVSGAIIYILLQEGLKFLGMPDDVAFNLRIIFFGLLIIILLYYRPQGLLGKLKLD